MSGRFSKIDAICSSFMILYTLHIAYCWKFIILRTKKREIRRGNAFDSKLLKNPALWRAFFGTVLLRSKGFCFAKVLFRYSHIFSGGIKSGPPPVGLQWSGSTDKKDAVPALRKFRDWKTSSIPRWRRCPLSGSVSRLPFSVFIHYRSSPTVFLKQKSSSYRLRSLENPPPPYGDNISWVPYSTSSSGLSPQFSDPILPRMASLLWVSGPVISDEPWYLSEKCPCRFRPYQSPSDG